MKKGETKNKAVAVHKRNHANEIYTEHKPNKQRNTQKEQKNKKIKHIQQNIFLIPSLPLKKNEKIV